MGTFCVAFSKMLKYATLLDFLPGAINEFLVDIVFEIGVALIGAAVTAYILGILLNQQQRTRPNGAPKSGAGSASATAKRPRQSRTSILYMEKS